MDCFDSCRTWHNRSHGNIKAYFGYLIAIFPGTICYLEEEILNLKWYVSFPPRILTFLKPGAIVHIQGVSKKKFTLRRYLLFLIVRKICENIQYSLVV